MACSYLLSDPHVEVVEVGVAAVGLPALLAAVLVASVDGDGVQRVGLPVVVANPCSSPESRETSVSYCHPRIISPKWKRGKERCVEEMGRWRKAEKTGRRQGGKKKSMRMFKE